MQCSAKVSPHTPRDDGQRLRVPLQALGRTLQATPSTTYPNATLHTPQERKGGTLHPDASTRVGVRKALPNIGRVTARTPAWLRYSNQHRTPIGARYDVTHRPTQGRINNVPGAND